jgi:hypothetical protein
MVDQAITVSIATKRLKVLAKFHVLSWIFPYDLSR